MSLDQDVRRWLDVHEETSYVGGGSTVCDDPDGGLLRYSRALRAVLDEHQPQRWYEECAAHPIPDDDDATHDHFWEFHQYVGDAGLLVCEESRAEDRCAGCTPDGADDDTVMSVHYPCPTLLALAAALGVGTDRDEGEQ